MSPPDGPTPDLAMLDRNRESLRRRARADLGMAVSGPTPPLRAVLQEHELSAYPLYALGALGVVDTFQSYAFTVMTPEIGRALGLSLTAIAGARAVQFLAVSLSPLPMAALSQRRMRRALLCIVTGFAWSAMTLVSGFVTSLLGLLVVLALDGFTSGSVAALHPPFLMDSYPPQARVRAMSAYQALVTSANVLSPLLVGILAGVFDLTWRGVFLALGGLSTLGAVGSLWLRDPGVGRFDTQRVRDEVGPAPATAPSTAPQKAPDNVELGFFEVMRRLMLIPTIQRTLAGYLVFGILVIPFATFVSEFLDERWGLGPGARGVFFAGVASVGVAGLLLWGRQGEERFRRDPARVIGDAGNFLALAVVVVAAAALMPQFWLMFAGFALGSTLIALLSPGLHISTLSIVDARWRPHLAALSGMAQAAGSLIGVVFLSGIDQRFGVAGAIVALMIPGMIGALIIRSARHLINGDIDRMIDEVVETEELRQILAAGGRLPMLACQGVDFSYGPLQVLFDVDFAVDDGEMVALLGVNGAGKSTLLKVISGIGLPSKGTVRIEGQDITYLDAERRLHLGITQIPGGRAVFGSMTVTENLRLFGYSLGADRQRIDEAIDRCFAAFPRLAERQSQNSATLSGGEQQMLGLSKALVLRPKLLLIDELSLGLAPVIVGQLLDMVRRINDDGTAVVLVEQSVNIALDLASHAYFMEKGAIRFDGASEDLLRREDLLRAVFLEGVAAGVGDGP